jgi:hypothetical protein
MWIDNLAFVYGTVGIEGVTFSKELHVYADPSTRQIVLTSSFTELKRLDISLLNVSGIECRNWKKEMHQSTQYLDINNLTPGIYIIRILSDNQVVDSRKITIMR